MDFLEQRKKQLGIRSLGDKIRSGSVNFKLNPELFIKGPEEFDCLYDKWSRKEYLGILGGSGAGKSAIVLYFFKKILENNPLPNAVCIFVSLEMTEESIARRWITLVGENSPLTDKLFIIGKYDEEGKPRNLTSHGILSECLMHKNGLGLDILSVAVDHLHIVQESGPKEDLNARCSNFKHMAVELNTFLMLLSQVPKEKAGHYSDQPLYRDDSFGNSGFAWYASYIISIHQPLKRVFNESRLSVLAWAYVKIREASEQNGATENNFKLMYYDVQTGTPRKMSKDEIVLFNQYFSLVIQKREAEDKNKGRKIASYDIKDSTEVSQEESESLDSLDLPNVD